MNGCTLGLAPTAEWSKITLQEVLMKSRFVCAAALAAFYACAMAQSADISPEAQFTADSKADNVRNCGKTVVRQ
jgi:hypothetical protein